MSFACKRVAISGATGGIGRATAKRFSHAGAELVLIDLDKQALTALANELGSGTTYFSCDQRQTRAIEQTVGAIGAVDVFVNNAGVIVRKPLLEMTMAETADLLLVNVTGSILMATGIARHMVAQRSGVIFLRSTHSSGRRSAGYMRLPRRRYHNSPEPPPSSGRRTVSAWLLSPPGPLFHR